MQRTTQSGSRSGPGVYFYKQQDGNDGRVEVIDGQKRTKWNYYHTLIEYCNFGVGVNRDTGFPSCWSSWNFGYLPGVTVPPNMALKAQDKLLNKIKGHSFNLAVAVGQGKETVNMTLDALSTLRSLNRAVRRGDFKAAARAIGGAGYGHRLSSHRFISKSMAGRWLELQYGWIPLLSDVHEAWSAYHQICAPPRITTVRASVRDTFTFNYNVDTSGIPIPANGQRRYLIIHEMTEQLAVPRQLGLTDPASVVWELCPYSFVVDWFIPIGTYLSNLNQIPHLNGRTLSTFKVSAEANYDVSGDRHYSGCRGLLTQSEMTRSIGSLSVPFPTFVSLPDALSPRRFLNALALTRQLFR